MAAIPMSIRLERDVSITHSTNDVKTGETRYASNSLVVEMMLTPDDDTDLNQKMGIVRLRIEAEPKRFDDLKQSEMFEFVCNSIVKMIQSEGIPVE